MGKLDVDGASIAGNARAVEGNALAKALIAEYGTALFGTVKHLDGIGDLAEDAQTLTNQLNSGGDTATMGSDGGADTNDPIIAGSRDYKYLRCFTDRTDASNGNKISQSTTNCPSGTDNVDLYFRLRWPDSVSDLDSVGGFWYDTGGVADGPGLRAYSNDVQVDLLWREDVSSGATIARSVTNFVAGNDYWLRVRYRYDVGGRTIVYLDVSEDDTNDYRAVKWSPDTSMTTDSADLVALAPSATVPFQVGVSKGGTGDIRPWGDNYYRAVYELAGEVQADFYPDRDDTGDDSGWTDPYGNAWSIGRHSSGNKNIIVRTASVIQTDGIDDYIQLPASLTPTFTSAAGKYTVVVVAREFDIDSSDVLFSTESASNDGALMFFTATNSVVIRLGGATTTVSLTRAPLDPGDVLVVGMVQNDGQLLGYDDDNGVSSSSSTAGVGTITHNQPRIGCRASAVVNPTDMDFFAVLIFDGKALNERQLNAVAEYLKGLA